MLHVRELPNQRQWVIWSQTEIEAASDGGIDCDCTPLRCWVMLADPSCNCVYRLLEVWGIYVVGTSTPNTINTTFKDTTHTVSASDGMLGSS